MKSRRVARHTLVTRRIEEVSGIRPVTLLIASGIILITAILLVTGIAANHLRGQALSTANGELARIGSVLAAASNRSLNAVDARLADLADSLGPRAFVDAAAFRAVAAAPDAREQMQRRLGGITQIEAAALVAADGDILSHAGTWPGDLGPVRALVAALLADAGLGSTLGPAIRDPQTGATVIPVAHRIDDASGAPLGAAVGIVPTSYFSPLFEAAPLPEDAQITLRLRDGSILMNYPERPRGPAFYGIEQSAMAALFRDPSAWMIRHVATQGDDWQIEGWRALSDYPAAVSVSRGAGSVLAEWAHQGLWFGGFAVVISIVIGIVIYLIVRQLHTYEALAEMRANRIEAAKIETDRALLAAESELLKSERLAVLGQLTATVAHELRNPLSAIRNTLFTLKEIAANAGVKFDRPIGRMERSIERCDRIISDLLEYTRNRELNRTSVRFDRWVADLLAEQNVKPPVVLASELQAGDPTLLLDADRVRRVVINLVENAAQALAETPPEREQRITVRTAVEDGEIVLAVEDTGPGIAPENLERIFEPLFSTKSFGTGLGLPTVKQIVNQHGGTITVESRVGHGTCVSVRLPLPEQVAIEENVMVAA